MIEKTLSRKTLYQGRFLEFVEDSVEIETNPPLLATRQYLLHPGGVCILPQLDSEHIILVKQYRSPVSQLLYEIPAGKIDPNEDPLKTAQRELREETGYTAEQWVDLGPTYPCPGYSNEILYVYFAKGLKLGVQDLDDGELVEAEPFKISQVLDLIDQGVIRDSKTIAAILLARKLLNL